MRLVSTFWLLMMSILIYRFIRSIKLVLGYLEQHDYLQGLEDERSLVLWVVGFSLHLDMMGFSF